MNSVGWLGVVVGIILVLVAFLGSQIGLGGTTFGPKHIIILVVGLVVLVVGLYLALRRPDRIAP